MKKPQPFQAEIPIAILVDDDTLVLYGAVESPIPTSGRVHLDAGTEAGRFRGACWPRPSEDGSGHWFLAGVQVPNLARLRPNRVEIAGDDGSRMVIPRLTNVRTNPAPLVAALCEEQAGASGIVLDFLCALLAPTAGTSERASRLLLGLLQDLARPDGYAEIFGRFRGGTGLMIQGWSVSMRSGMHDLMLEGEDCRLHGAVAADFPRADLPPTADGFVAVLPDADVDPATIRRVFCRTADGWCHLQVFENRTLLPDGIAVAHLRDMLSGLRGDARTLQSLREIAASQYEGHETVSRIEGPLRAALDTAVRVPGSGVFLGGWLLDPTGMVEAVTLRGPGLAVRLDADWARTARRDVSEAFSADPAFAGRILPGLDDHGFLAFVPEPADLDQAPEFHLQIDLNTGGRAFLPVAPQPPSPDQLRRLLSAIDLNDPAAESVVARHIGPTVQAMAAGRGPAPAAAVFPLGPTLGAPRLSVVIPVTDAREDLDLTLARLACDPDFLGVEILVAAGCGSHPRLAANLRCGAEFYRLPLRLVSAPGARDAFEAADAALAHARAEQVLLLSPSVLPTERGWLSALERAARRAGRPAVLSPTLAYEDHSVRYAGILADETASGGYVARYAGYPLSWLKETEPMAVDAATLDCALLPRAVVRAAGGLAGSYLGPEYKGLDFCLRLRGAGHSCLWVPAVRLVALDEAATGEPDYWQQTGALVDRWRFESAWTARTSDAA
ncbi:glycosyltransferase family 2 protein [Arenibaculum pallidiluteum]|uniref:glycosyltransferase family 2 protein n=1 Tax=Arenibaculum pallidiluteum TaxID=2812559 RepID=UPI001A96C81D|nr:hypothetical protein [Arenibaculum pallidiluteum]